MRIFTQTSEIAASAEEVFEWHARPGAFERLRPPWEPVELVERQGTIRDGDRTVLRVKTGPFWRKWVAEHLDYVEGRQFCDVQRTGPFARWEHLHQFEPLGPERSRLEDRIEYALPLSVVGDLVAGRSVARKLRRVFGYRHRVTIADIVAHRRFAARTPLRVLISGSNGLVGSALVPMLTSGGHSVVRLARAESDHGGLRWNPEAGEIDAERLEGFDAVVHLAGEGIASRRWNAAQKAKIRDSRERGTRLLAETLGRLKSPPKVLVGASAIGYYGNRGDEICTEQSAPGDGFLAEVCAAWEAAAEPARAAGIRTVNARLGIVLSPAGGALPKMMLPFKLGAGGKVGNGRQWMSWVAIDDVVGAIHHALLDENVSGPMNVVAPHPATNRDFTKTLGRVLFRPSFLPAPAFALRLALGQMADELLLASQRVQPQTLAAAGYAFRFPELEPALRHVLGR